MRFNFAKFSIGLLSALAFTACGGGGGGSTGGGSGPVGGGGSGGGASGPTYTAGVFQAASGFKNRCASPRSGTNPATGDPYPDRAGSTLFENHWLRSWSNETYLWYSEIPDQNPANFNDPLVYFDELKTDALTPSGNPKDQFHFTYDTADYQQRVSGSTFGYGAEWALLSPTVPRDIRVAFVETGTPARRAPASLTRGAKILEIDGVDAVNDSTQAGVDILNDALFPDTAGETHSFTVLDVGSNTPRTFTMSAQDIATKPAHTVDIINTAAGPVGYLHFTTFGTSVAEDALITAMQQFDNAGVNELVIDLRYNGGGFLAISSQMAYMAAGPANTANRTYSTMVFNDKNPTFNPVTNERLEPTPFYNQTLGFSRTEGQPLPTLDLDRVFILSTDGTCSASEAVINGLRGINVEVVLIGTRTCGKPYGFYATDNCGTTYFTIQFRGENAKGFGDYADGFAPQNISSGVGELIPGCAIADDYNNALGSTSEALLAGAITYIETGGCPAGAPAMVAAAQPKTGETPGDEIGNLLEHPKARDYYRLRNSWILDERTGAQETR